MVLPNFIGNVLATDGSGNLIASNLPNSITNTSTVKNNSVVGTDGTGAIYTNTLDLFSTSNQMGFGTSGNVVLNVDPSGSAMALHVKNTGVNSEVETTTTNHIVSGTRAYTNTVNLSTGSSLIAASGCMVGMSTLTSILPNGNTQSSGTPLSNNYNNITISTSTNNAVVLSNGSVGSNMLIVNNGTYAVSVFPTSGGQINSLGTNNVFTLPIGYSCLFVLTSLSPSLWISCNMTSNSSNVVSSNTFTLGQTFQGNNTFSGHDTNSSSYTETFSSGSSATFSSGSTLALNGTVTGLASTSLSDTSNIPRLNTANTFTGNQTFPGIYLPTTGGTPGLVTEYEVDYNFSTTFTLSGSSGGTSPAVTIFISMIGNQVSMKLFNFTIAAGSSPGSLILSNTALPSRFITAYSPTSCITRVLDNGTVYTGWVRFVSGGYIQIYKDPNADNFTANTTVGLDETVMVNYSI